MDKGLEITAEFDICALIKKFICLEKYDSGILDNLKVVQCLMFKL